MSFILAAQTTSSLFSKLLVTVRNVLLVLWGVAVYGDVVSGGQLTGYLITLGAFLMYTYYKVWLRQTLPIGLLT